MLTVRPAASLRLGADHERVAPHGLRLLGTMLALLAKQSQPVQATFASWLEAARGTVVGGIQSASMKVRHCSAEVLSCTGN